MFLLLYMEWTTAVQFTVYDSSQGYILKSESDTDHTIAAHVLFLPIMKKIFVLHNYIFF